MVNRRTTMTVTDVAHVGRISNIHINAASAKIATVLCSIIERIGVPLSVTPKNDLGTNQKKRNTAMVRRSIMNFFTGNAAAGLTVSVDILCF